MLSATRPFGASSRGGRVRSEALGVVYRRLRTTSPASPLEVPAADIHSFERDRTIEIRHDGTGTVHDIGPADESEQENSTKGQGGYGM